MLKIIILLLLLVVLLLLLLFYLRQREESESEILVYSSAVWQIPSYFNRLLQNSFAELFTLLEGLQFIGFVMHNISTELGLNPQTTLEAQLALNLTQTEG